MGKIVTALAVIGMACGTAFAHCDSMDGPVISAARAALESGNAAPVLVWVQPADEAAIKDAFGKAREVRRLGGKAAELADTWFFETLVRVHRAGEGAPYTGLKPAGSAEEIVKDADASLDNGDIAPLAEKISSDARYGIVGKFAAVMQLKTTAGQSVEKGRAYVAAYVDFIHYVENVKNAVHGGPHHAGETAGEPAHED